jgi:hypothetical protein
LAISQLDFAGGQVHERTLQLLGAVPLRMDLTEAIAAIKAGTLEAVIYGHLHIRRSHRLDGVRFEEVSLGYPRQWKGRIAPRDLLREIYPGSSAGNGFCFG